jgi:alkylation response protein AidB-like acyl-CoA dehydrogenase
MSVGAEEDVNTRMIRDSVQAFVSRDGDLARIRQSRFKSPGFSQSMFVTMAELGWLGLRVPEVRGGVGLGVTALCAVAEGLGAGLVPEPLIACATVAPLLPDDQLNLVLTGEFMVVPAWQEGLLAMPHTLLTTAIGGKVNGKRFVAASDAADAFVVTTAQGLALVVREQKGVLVKPVGTQDGGFAGDIIFTDAQATMLQGSFDQAFADGALATAAYLFGAAERMFDITLDYLKTRQQFGKPIGAFQALQHRAAELKIQIELSRSVIAEACATVDSSADPKVKASAVSRAKARIADTASLIAREATQFHGAIGITDELDLTLFTRKILTVYNAYGTSAEHRSRYARLNFQ